MGTRWIPLSLLVLAAVVARGLAGEVNPASAASQELDPAASAELDLARDEVYTAVKQLGAEPDVLVAALARLSDEAAEGRVDDASIQDVTGTIADFDVAMKIESLLRGYAEQAAKRPRLAALLEPGTLEPLDPLDPLNGGTCLTCPSFDFGPFTPTLSWQYHEESTDSSGDCNVYAFIAVAGTAYEFSLCSDDGAMAGWDTRLTLRDGVSCAILASDDDACGLQSRVRWTSPFTGTLLVTVEGIRGSPAGDFGSYRLGYRIMNCSTCTSPIGPLVMTTDCQIATGTINSVCTRLFWQVRLVASVPYEFTTCPTSCAQTSCTTISDTVLELFAPGSTNCTSAAGDRVAISDDAVPSCTGMLLRSHITYIAPVTGVYTIKARAFSVQTSGTICMGYRQIATAFCPNTCANGPFLATLVPTSTCQTTSSSIRLPCTDAWYLVSVSAAGPYEFTTCAVPACAGGFAAGMDPRLELYSNSCSMLASDDDGCGVPRSNLTLNIPTPGTYKLRLRSMNAVEGGFAITYRAVGNPCVPPSNVTIRPTSGVASSAVNSCSVTQAFNVTSSGTSSMTYNWSITTPVGGAATPSAGATLGASSPSNPASFSSTLVRQGVYTVNVSAVNACGSSSASIGFQLLDRTAPVFTSFPPNTSVECDSILPAPALSASDNCDPNPVETFSETITPGSCPGRYTITRTWSATDLSGNVSAPRSQVLNVVDRTPPSIVPDTTVKYCLYPPNHELGCFVLADFSPVILESCSGPVTWRFTGILNSETAFPGACPPGDLDPDTVIGVGGSSFCVRAERCGTDPSLDDGRTYLVFATATDACGNTSQPRPIGAVLVPHDTADTSNCITP